jgi:tetratricopeptide (TPR) repeat protein
VEWIQLVLSSSNLRDPDLHVLLAVALLNEDRAGDAIPHLEKALAANPGSLGLHIALVRAHFETGNLPAAHQAIRRLQELGYPHIRDFAGLVTYYAHLGETGERATAWLFFRNNLRRRPDDIVLLNNAAWLLATAENPPAPPAEALQLARRAADLDPAAHPAILDTLAAALAAAGQFDEAVQTAQQALDLARAAGDHALAADLQRRLATYARQQPWRPGP